MRRKSTQPATAAEIQMCDSYNQTEECYGRLDVIPALYRNVAPRSVDQHTMIIVQSEESGRVAAHDLSLNFNG